MTRPMKKSWASVISGAPHLAHETIDTYGDKLVDEDEAEIRAGGCVDGEDPGGAFRCELHGFVCARRH